MTGGAPITSSQSSSNLTATATHRSGNHQSNIMMGGPTVGTVGISSPSPLGGSFLKLEQDWRETHMAYLQHRSISTSRATTPLGVRPGIRPSSAASLRSGRLMRIGGRWKWHKWKACWDLLLEWSWDANGLPASTVNNVTTLVGARPVIELFCAAGLGSGTRKIWLRGCSQKPPQPKTRGIRYSEVSHWCQDGNTIWLNPFSDG